MKPSKGNTANKKCKAARVDFVPTKHAVARKVGLVGTKRPGVPRGSISFTAILDANSSGLVAMTRHGVDSAVAVALAQKLDVPTSRIAPWIGLSRATLDRKIRNHDTLDLVASDRVVRFTQLWKLAVRLWGSENAARQWLTMPEQALGGMPPVEAAVTEIGSRQVEDLMGQIAHGIAT